MASGPSSKKACFKNYSSLKIPTSSACKKQRLKKIRSKLIFPTIKKSGIQQIALAILAPQSLLKIISICKVLN